MIFTGWESPLALLKYELVQLDYEGVVVPSEIINKVKDLDDETHKMDFDLVDKIYVELETLKVASSFKYDQPYALNDIKKARPAGPRKLDSISDADLINKFHGAWTGRSVGCALGKPVEGMGIRGQKGLIGRAAIKQYLENRGHWPLDYYFSGEDVNDGFVVYCPNSQRENISFMEPDDDIHYTLIALAILEKYGAEFTWRHVAHTWNNCLPYNVICTAESQAILNYNNATPRSTVSDWVTPEYTSSNRNPYREWIGAQIRADGWGYGCAGNPELAAEFAYRDACWTHRANGIYGEMMFAAIIAAAFSVDDPIDLINIGLSEIPENCKLAEASRRALSEMDQTRDFYKYMDWVEAEFGELSGVHTVNNALVVIGALFYGKSDFHQSVCYAIEGGWDTDCNGATCGSILGAIHGRSNMNSSLIPPLNDTIKPSVIGFQEITMERLAQRTYEVFKSIKDS